MPVTLSPSCVQPTPSSRHRRQQQRREKEANARREREISRASPLLPCRIAVQGRRKAAQLLRSHRLR
ncbi:uncharacterized protein DS421_12g367590 [Arachis hypogaea]|nr:uncharacterized protein DS421_12g367590 [Arachis hypogaea]